MTQDTFNRIITVILFLFFLAMYVVSFVTGRILNWEQLLPFLVPTLNHVVHQYTQSRVTTKNIEATAATDVAKIQANGYGSNRS